MRKSIRNFTSSQQLRWLLLILGLALLGLWGFNAKLSNSIATIPIVDWDAGLPIVEVDIMGHKRRAMVDLGSKLDLAIYDNPAELGLKQVGKGGYIPISGLKIERPNYLAKSVHLGSIAYHNKSVLVQNKEDAALGSLTDSNSTGYRNPYYAHIGRGILQEHGILIDAENSKIIICDDPSQLSDLGYAIESFRKLPFKRDPQGIIVETESCLGKHQLILDTGATVTLMRNSLTSGLPTQLGEIYKLPSIQSEFLKLNGENFGSHRFYFVEMTPLIKFDGLLGMDFIRRHQIYIDFAAGYLLIKP